ncbi:hypothetical protein E3N88_45843 [Mikania micrantha]|uniref:Gnk2-homologous domain-containing protein n=1 Tax=Mikania micrantha TaxID=192012 RepID=A0A5N6L846_9ASTR|nr:hypothetical protein E3N88_45843 [Mikania micrantha]
MLNDGGFHDSVRRAVANAVIDAPKNSDFFARDVSPAGAAIELVYVLAGCLVRASESVLKCLPSSEGGAVYTGCFLRFDKSAIVIRESRVEGLSLNGSRYAGDNWLMTPKSSYRRSRLADEQKNWRLSLSMTKVYSYFMMEHKDLFGWLSRLLAADFHDDIQLLKLVAVAMTFLSVTYGCSSTCNL